SAACPRGSYAHVGRLGGYYDLKYYQTCDRLLVNTEDIAAWCHNAGWPADKVECVPNFVEGTRADPLPRQQFFTPRRAPLVLGLGRLHENKGFDVLLKAMACIPGAYLWLAGEGPLKGELDALAQKLGIKPRVRFLGWRSDVAALYASCDVFVCPSRHEPLGNVVIESWAHGLPVVATDSLGPGTLIDHLQTGVLVAVDDAESLASAIRLVLEDDELKRRIVAQGQAAYEARFAETVVVPQFVRFFERMRAPCAASPA
ncbi:MAG: glycosyltransferase, partial [Alphaproteobacteria bacterium]|nr:glycosyltransferase [Alphaproteobacteria bacterium]